MSSPITDVIRNQVRARFAADMIDSVLVQRGGPGAFDEGSMSQAGMANPVTIYEGKARLPRSSGQGQVSLTEGEISMQSGTCQIPWDATQVYVNDIITIVTAQDPQMVGTVWRITAVDGGGSWAALRTLSMTTWAPSSQWDGTEDA